MADETPPRTLKRPLLWVLAVLLLAGVPVQVTGIGIDVFVLLTVGAVLFGVERTLGDAVAEFIGPIGAAVLFSGIAAISFGYMLTESGQHRAKRFLAAAEAHGYQPLYFTPERVRNEDDPALPKGPDDDEIERVRKASDPRVVGKREPDAKPTRDAVPAPAEGVPVSPGLFSSLRAADVPLARLKVSPDIVLAGETVNLEVRFVGGPVTVRGPLVFFVNDREVARGTPDADGTTAVHITARYPGLYNAAVRLPAGTRATAPGIVSFTVLPSRK